MVRPWKHLSLAVLLFIPCAIHSMRRKKRLSTSNVRSEKVAVAKVTSGIELLSSTPPVNRPWESVDADLLSYLADLKAQLATKTAKRDEMHVAAELAYSQDKLDEWDSIIDDIALLTKDINELQTSVISWVRRYRFKPQQYQFGKMNLVIIGTSHHFGTPHEIKLQIKKLQPDAILIEMDQERWDSWSRSSALDHHEDLFFVLWRYARDLEHEIPFVLADELSYLPKGIDPQSKEGLDLRNRVMIDCVNAMVDVLGKESITLVLAVGTRHLLGIEQMLRKGMDMPHGLFDTGRPSGSNRSSGISGIEQTLRKGMDMPHGLSDTGRPNDSTGSSGLSGMDLP